MLPSRLTILLPLAFCTACAHIPQKSESMKRADLESSTSELRTLAVEMGRESLRQIEIAADSIDAATESLTVHRNTLYLRLSSVTAITEASLQPDPVHAMLDLYAFRLQLANFVSSPAGYAAFGDQMAIAQRALDRNASRWEAVAQSTGGRLTDSGRTQITSWAQSHPIDHLPFTRTSLASALAATLREQDLSIGAAVGGMQESIDRLEFRISLLNENALKQAAWLSQLAALELKASPDVAELRGTLHSTRELIEDTPGLVAHERRAVLSEVDKQRRETLAALTLEFDRQRVALMEAVASERVIVLSTVDELRQQIMRDADSLRLRLVEDGIRVVDHLMLRLAELSAALLLLAVIGWRLLIRRASARGV